MDTSTKRTPVFSSLFLISSMSSCLYPAVPVFAAWDFTELLVSWVERHTWIITVKSAIKNSEEGPTAVRRLVTKLPSLFDIITYTSEQSPPLHKDHFLSASIVFFVYKFHCTMLYVKYKRRERRQNLKKATIQITRVNFHYLKYCIHFFVHITSRNG